jgi:hypothetical protein
MRNTARLLRAAGMGLGAAASLLFVRCDGTTIQSAGSAGGIQISGPPDSPEVTVRPTWEVQFTPLPTPTPTPIA